MGPYQPTLAALPWNSATHSLLVWGASDVGKTQFIAILLHTNGDLIPTYELEWIPFEG